MRKTSLLDVADVECPHCGALPLFECMTKRGTAIRGMHIARHEEAGRITQALKPVRYSGRIWKDGKHWLISCPRLDLMTQGTSVAHAHAMLKDAIETLVNKPGFTVKVIGGAMSDFAECWSRVSITSTDREAMEQLAAERNEPPDDGDDPWAWASRSIEARHARRSR